MNEQEQTSSNRNRRVKDILYCENGRVADPDRAIESWRIFKIMAEFVSGFEVLERYDLAATFFGSSRCELGDKIYQQTTELSRRLSQSGFAIITGGGSGIMEAANKGAYETKGASVGLNIQIPDQQILNKYVMDSEGFHYFFTRKVMLAFASEVYVFMPGGFGTLDELFELATLVQTKKIRNIPLVLIGKNYWEPLLSWVQREVYTHSHAISKEDLDIFNLVDSVDEAYELIMERTKEAREAIQGNQ
jgi:hypothetical protein